VTANRHEELGDGPAPYADFGHGSLFEGAPGARQLSAVQSAYLSTKFHREPCLVCMERAELYAYMKGSEFKTSGLWPGQTRPRLEHGAQQFPVSSFRGCWIGIFA